MLQPISEIGSAHVSGALALVLCSVLWFVYRSNIKAPKGVPPGSFGWPLVGDTIKFLTWRKKAGAFALFREKRKKYGHIFKTHIFNVPTVVITGPEAHKLLQNDGYRSLTSGHSTHMYELFGQSLLLADGEKHKQMRKAILGGLNSRVLKNQIPILEQFTIQTLRSWEGKEVFAAEECAKFTFYSILGLLTSMRISPQAEKLRHLFSVYAKDGINLRLKFPGTPYNRALQARQNLVQEMKKMIELRRKGGQQTRKDDVLDHLMNGHERWQGDEISSNNSAGKDESVLLTDDEIIDNMLFFIFSGYETTSTALSRVVQLLADNPRELDLVKVEHKQIREEIGRDASLPWEKVKNVPYTTMAINETLRLSHLGTEASVRMTKTDIVFEGYLIPKGWSLIVDKASTDIDPKIFIEPHKFNPSRFKENIPPYVFMPFGGGVRSCPGMEFANLEIVIFIHFLVNNYRWALTTPYDGLEYSGIVPKPKSGIPIFVERLS